MGFYLKLFRAACMFFIVEVVKVTPELITIVAIGISVVTLIIGFVGVSRDNKKENNTEQELEKNGRRGRIAAHVDKSA